MIFDFYFIVFGYCQGKHNKTSKQSIQMAQASEYVHETGSGLLLFRWISCHAINDTDRQSFTSSPMLLSLKDWKATLATFVNNYASNSLKHSGPRFNENVVAMMYVAIDCIVNSRSISALPSEVQDRAALSGLHSQLSSWRWRHS